MESNFVDSEWTGEFFLPDQIENRFFGQITFSPEYGVILAYFITGKSTPDDSEILHGVLDTGEKCTLIGKFTPTDSNICYQNGLNTRRGTSGFYFLVVGDFLDEGELFSEVTFSLTGMQEFFFPNGCKDLVKYSDEPLFKTTNNYGQIEAGQIASFSMLGSDVTRQIYNTNDDALTELKLAYEEINTKHEDSFFMLKEDVSYMVTIKTNVASTVSTLYKHIVDISNLFAVLIYGPVHPEIIKLKKDDENGRPYLSTVYSSMALDKRTVNLCKNRRSHYRMPITESNIDIAKAISNWLEKSRKHSIIVSSLQYETGFATDHSVHGELVMYATHFESISHSNSIKNRTKYEYPVSQFGTEKIRNSLTRIFSDAGETDFGKGIGDLRNEIAHIGRKKRLLAILDLQDMVDISMLLRITILGYVLNDIGLNKKVINDYQDKWLP